MFTRGLEYLKHVWPKNCQKIGMGIPEIGRMIPEIGPTPCQRPLAGRCAGKQKPHGFVFTKQKPCRLFGNQAGVTSCLGQAACQLLHIVWEGFSWHCFGGNTKAVLRASAAGGYLHPLSSEAILGFWTQGGPEIHLWPKIRKHFIFCHSLLHGLPFWDMSGST